MMAYDAQSIQVKPLSETPGIIRSVAFRSAQIHPVRQDSRLPRGQKADGRSADTEFDTAAGHLALELSENL